jgi:hypothetical protein
MNPIPTIRTDPNKPLGLRDLTVRRTSLGIIMEIYDKNSANNIFDVCIHCKYGERGKCKIGPLTNHSSYCSTYEYYL